MLRSAGENGRLFTDVYGEKMSVTSSLLLVLGPRTGGKDSDAASTSSPLISFRSSLSTEVGLQVNTDAFNLELVRKTT
jgi:hypothetical protein